MEMTSKAMVNGLLEMHKLLDSAGEAPRESTQIRFAQPFAGNRKQRRAAAAAVRKKDRRRTAESLR